MSSASMQPAPAPIVLFAYAREAHLRRTIASLQANPLASRTALVVYCDAAKSPERADDVEAVRRYVRTVGGFASVRHVFRDRNMGLAASIIDGVSRELVDSDRVIVVEDDLVVSPHFLTYMNDGLVLYANDDRVASIHGYVYPVAEALPDTFFLRGADCWGWATWRRAWQHFEADGPALLKRLQQAGLTHAFDLDGAYPYTRMLKDQIAGRNNSWAIRWHASSFLRNALTLYPGTSLVDNIGNDASGTHCNTTDVFAQRVAGEALRVERIPLEPSARARDAFVRFFRTRQPGLVKRAGRWLRVLPRAAA